jgi:hypothetical protein
LFCRQRLAIFAENDAFNRFVLNDLQGKDTNMGRGFPVLRAYLLIKSFKPDILNKFD